MFRLSVCGAICMLPGQHDEAAETQRPPRPQSVPGRSTLFGGEVIAEQVCPNPKLKTGSAVVFRCPRQSSCTPHTRLYHPMACFSALCEQELLVRPIFLVGGNSEDLQ
eukprot:2184811-Amphidinium_carterae.1